MVTYSYFSKDRVEYILVLGLNLARSLGIMHIPRYHKAGFFGSFFVTIAISDKIP